MYSDINIEFSLVNILISVLATMERLLLSTIQCCAWSFDKTQVNTTFNFI